MIRLGIIGTGVMAKSHIENIVTDKVKNVKLTALCDLVESKMDKLINDFNLNCKKYINYQDLIDSKECDAVLVCTYHYSHPTIAKYALEHNTHCIIEKPAGVFIRDVEEVNEVARKSNLKFGIMYNQRTNPMYQKARQMVQEKEIGELKRVNWIITTWYRSNAYYRSSDWRGTWNKEGGGVLINQDPHQIDLLQWICGMPKKVYAFAKFGSNRNICVDDDVTAIFDFGNNVSGVFVTSVHDMPGTNRLEISGTKGQIIIENGEMVFNRLEMDEREFNQVNEIPMGKPKVVKEVVDIKENQWGYQHAELLNNFIEGILFNKELLAPGVEGINGLMISNAMHLSSYTQKEVEIDFEHVKEFENILEDLKEKEVL